MIFGNPDKKETLSSLLDQMNAATSNACKSIDDAIEYVELSNKRIEKMESEARKARSTLYKMTRS